MPSFNKVRVNSIYEFQPVPLDVYDSKVSGVKPGDKVRVINLPGAPKANTMNHCYIETRAGDFCGMVCCNSLIKTKKAAA